MTKRESMTALERIDQAKYLFETNHLSGFTFEDYLEQAFQAAEQAARKEERESCARIADKNDIGYWIAQAIRARTEG